MKNILIGLLCAVFLSSCGGGGGGSDSDSGGGASSGITAKQSVFSVDVNRESRSEYFSVPVDVSIPSSTNSVYFYLLSDKGKDSGVTGVSLDIYLDADSSVAVYYSLPDYLSSDGYDESLTLYFCYDENCNDIIPGSPFNIQLEVDYVIPKFSKTLDDTYEIERRADGPLESIKIDVPVENVLTEDLSFVHFESNSGYSLECSYGDDVNLAECLIPISEFSSLSEQEVENGRNMKISICERRGCDLGVTFDSKSINIKYRLIEIPTLDVEEIMYWNNTSEAKTTSVYSAFYDALLSYYYSNETNTTTLVITPMDGEPRIFIDLKRNITTGFNKLHVNELNGKIYTHFRTLNSTHILSITPDLVDPQASRVAARSLSLTNPDYTAITSDSFFATEYQSDSDAVYGSRIDLDSEVEIDTYGPIAAAELSIISKNNQLFGSLKKNSSSSDLTIHKFFDNNILEIDSDNFKITPISEKCNDLLEAGKYIFNNCGDRLKLSLNESDEPDVVDSIPKPPWYVKGDSGYLNRELLDVFFLSNESGFFYFESGRSTFSSRLKYYITRVDGSNVITNEYFTPKALLEVYGMFQAKDGSIWLYGIDKYRTGKLAKLKIDI
ncbi:hypothetical protein [Enterovibrio norvegicus]|uniref:hypothetical protein n=1 Tax=Enterovibrio norvegicus TaxID=188144 RepID=UPI0013D4B0D1|nr:hypothetical protein [Enterovibrio norvegicus]